MTVKFRVNEFSAHTQSGDAKYSFPSPLTVLAGPVAVGKSTLFEAMKYALGCDALLSGVIRADVQSVSIDVSLGNERYLLKRLITTPEATTVDVYDVQRDTLLGPYSTTSREEDSLNSLLLNALGLPDDMLAASSATNTKKKGSRVSFADVWKYLYVPQAEINQSVASSDNSWYTPKRKAVFELLFDLTSPEILQSQSESALARSRLEEVERSAQTVRQFLKDSRTPSRNDLDVRRAQASDIRREAENNLAEIREGLAPAIDGETQVLRELLLQAEERLAEARSVAVATRQQLGDFQAERVAVQDDIARLSRMKMAGERIAQIEFVNCPRCMQSLKQRVVPDDHCTLCLQLDPVPRSDSGNLSAEASELQSQLIELTNQTDVLEEELRRVNEATEDRSATIYRLSEVIRDRTSDRITPALQAYADATSKVATTSVQLREIEERLLQWDRADDLEEKLEAERAALTKLERRTTELKEAIADRKKEVLAELSEEYEATVTAIGVPGVVTATVDSGSYLPLINGTQLDKLSPAGGLRTTAIVSYWVTLLTVALRRRDTLHPGFLLLDSPRTSLNDSDSIASALYRRLVTLADAAEGRVQLIIGDNELPASYHRDYDQIDLSYESPAVSPISHPGVANVERLEG